MDEELRTEADSVATSLTSGLGATRHGPFEVNIAATKQVITVLRIATCKSCTRTSVDQPNPLVKGPRGRAEYGDCWPWARGPLTQPEKRLCYICEGSFELGFQDEQIPFMDDHLKERKTKPSLDKEFKAVNDLFVQRVNDGSITSRTRGAKKDRIKATFNTERKKQRKPIRSSLLM